MKCILILVFITMGQEVFSQRNCGTDLYNQDVISDYPELSRRYGRTNTDSELSVKLSRLVGKITIPVVVHVVYNNQSQDVSITEIESQIEQLNLDFSGKTDIDDIPEAFRNRIADCGFQFVLHSVKRTRTNTNRFLIKLRQNSNGERIYHPSYEPIKFQAQGGADGLPCTQFLNVWVGNISDGSPYQLLGYATFPGGLCEYDGVVIHHKYFGKINSEAPFNKGRTLTHEVGHWLNLRHIWGDSSCGSDFVDDTPTQMTSNNGCPSYPAVSCNNGPYGDMFMNFMDYVDDACMNLFTVRQKERMRSLFVEGGDRSSFLRGSENQQLFSNDNSRRDVFTPSITEFKKYFHCRPVHDTCRYAFVFWTRSDQTNSYRVFAKKVKSNTWEVITTDNNFVKMSGLNSNVLYEVKVQAILADSTYSAESTPYIFKLKGKNPFNFKKLELHR